MPDERDVLTRPIITKKLQREAKRSMIGAALMCLMGVVFGGALLLLDFSSSTAAAGDALIGVWIALWGLGCLVFFVRALLRMCKAGRGAFTVVEEALTEVKDHQFSLWQLILYGGWDILLGNKSHLYHEFRFESGKTFIANAEEFRNTRLGTAAEFSLSGDRFYLVTYDDRPNKIILLFSARTHVCRDLPSTEQK